jgi:malonyl-CoA O-methyltransferase
MSDDLPPTIDPCAAARWARRAQVSAPWLHEEIGLRMQERLQWIRLKPKAWLDWEPLRGGMQAHAAVARHYDGALCWVADSVPQRVLAAESALRAPWWQPGRWLGSSTRFGYPPDGGVDMVWANMALHMAAEPKDLLQTWHRMLSADGFLMFSCLGPDTLVELRGLYRSLGWPAPAHEFTDMHDWGDMLVRAGYAEPVMDMERVTLTFESPERLLTELRELGRNLHVQRFSALRGRAWHKRLRDALDTSRAGAGHDAPLTLTFEVTYGHALKPHPRLAVQGETVLTLDEMRRILQKGKADPGRIP